nr:hypothetical protein HAGR004_41300 [Bdellovibrio sp. HAGR004]
MKYSFYIFVFMLFGIQLSHIANSSKSKMCMHLANKLVGAVIKEEELHGGIPTIAKMEMLSERIRSFNNFQIESGCESTFAHSTTAPHQKGYLNLLLTLKAIESSYAKELGNPLSIVTKNILPNIAL